LETQETQEQTDGHHKPDVAHVTLSVDGAAPQPKEVPAGETVVSQLKAELGVDGTAVLWLLHEGKRRPLNNSESLDVESGMHFEAITGGGVS
jgi:hypothetical protein